MSTETITRPAFRQPWTSGAYAYPEADTFAAAIEGFKRRRKTVMFHMPNTGEAGTQPCTVCGGLLGEPAREMTGSFQAAAEKTPDRFSTWDYSPRLKAVGNGRHYQCSWGSLMVAILSLPI